MTKNVAMNVYRLTRRFGSQLMALPATVLTSLLKRLRRSPLLYRLRASQSASSTLSNTDAWISLLTKMLTLADTRETKLRSSRLARAEATMTAAMAPSREVW